MMADVIVDTMHDPLDVVTEKMYEDVDTQQTAKENMTEKLGATAEGADLEKATIGKEAQLDAAVHVGEDDASPDLRVESAEHAKDGVEHDVDGAHETSKDQPGAEAAEPEELTSKEDTFKTVTEEVGAPDDTTPDAHVEVMEHTKDGVEQAEDGALPEEQEPQQGQDKPEPISKEPSLNDSNPYGLDATPDGHPIGEENMTEKLVVPSEGAESEKTATGKEAQLDAAVHVGEDDASPGVRVESAEHAKDGVEQEADGAHEISKDQSAPEVSVPDDSVPKENMFEVITGKDATAEGTDLEDTPTEEEQHLGSTVNGKDDTTLDAHVEIIEHTKGVVEHAEDGALPEEQEPQQGQDKPNPTLKEPSLDDSNPYGLDTNPKGFEEGVPTGEVTTRVEQHSVVLEDVKPISDVEDTQAQAQGEDSPADDPLAVKPTEPVSDDKATEDTLIHVSEYPADHATAQDEFHADAIEEVKHQDESAEGEAVGETPISLEDKTAREGPVEGDEEKEEAPGNAEEVPSTTTIGGDSKAFEEESVAPTTEPESRPQVTSVTDSEVEKTEPTEHVSVERVPDGHEEEEKHEAEAEGGTHVAPIADPVDHQVDPEVEGTKDAAEVIGKEESGEPQLSEYSDSTTQHGIDASEFLAPPTTAEPQSETVVETEETEEKSAADAGELGEASKGTEEAALDDHPPEEFATTEPEKDESAEVQKDDGHDDVQEVPPTHVLASETSAPDHDHGVEEETRGADEVLDDQPTDAEVNAAPKRSDGGEELEEKEEPSHEEQIGEDVEAPGNEDAPTEQATAPTGNDEVPEGASEHSPVTDDVPVIHHRQVDSTEETEVLADVVEPSPSAEETKSSIDVDGAEHDADAEAAEVKALPSATEPKLQSEIDETGSASHVTEDDAPAPLSAETAKEEATEPTTVDTPVGSFDQTESETQEGDTPITSETAPPPTEEPRESDGAFVELSTPAFVHEPAATAERTADEVTSVQIDHEVAVDTTAQADAVRDSVTSEIVLGEEAKTEKPEEAEDAAPAELDTVEPETREVHADAPSAAEDEIAEQTGELHAAEDAVTTKKSDLSEVTPPETEESPAASDAPIHIETAAPQPENPDDDSVEELAVPIVSVAKEEEPNIPSAQLTDAPTAGVVQAEDSAADPEIEPLTEEHKEKVFEAVPVDTKDEQVAPPEVVVDSLTQVSEDAEAESIAVPPVHPVEASSEEVQHVEAVHSEARKETELEKPEAFDEATGELAQPSEVAEETLVEVNQHTEPEPSTVPAEEEPQTEMKGPNDPEAELTASIEPPAPTETMASADMPSHSEDAAAFDVADVTNNEEVSPPAAEIPPAHEAVPGPSTAESLLEEGQRNKEFGSALEVDSTTISEAVQDSKDEEAAAAVAPEVTSLDNPEPSALQNTDPEKVENNAVLSASISESAHAVGEIVNPESTSTSTESGSTVQVEHNTEVPTITANKEAVTEVDSQEVIEDVPASLENEEEKETTALGVEAERSDSVVEVVVPSVDAGSNNDAVEVEDVDTAPLEPYSGPREQEITAPSQEQDAEGQAPETVKELVEGEKDVVALTAGQEEVQPPEEEHYVAELPADKDLAVQEPLDEAHKELPEESAPEPAGAGSTAVDEATGAVADAVRSTTDQTGRLIVPETLELVSVDNAKATEETAHADEEQPSTPAALEETTPHASREDLSAGTHEQSSESATDAGISEESVPVVTIELPTPSNENFTYEDELNSSDTEELPDVLEKDIPSVTAAPESAYQARSTPTIVIPEVSNNAERTEGESASPKESTTLGNETPTAVHEIDEAATTPTEPLVEASRVSMVEQSDDAIRMQSIENTAAPTDVTEANVHEAAALEHSVEEISSQFHVAYLDKHEAGHAESILDSAQEYEASEPSVTIDVQEASTDAASSESLEDSKTDVPPGSPRALSVDTSVQDLPERPKSPWTPSYSVTQQGPGIITQPAEDDVLQDRVEIGEIVDSETDQENETQIDEGVPAESEIPVADPVELQKNDIRTKTPENIENHSEDESVTPKKGKEGQENTTPTKSVDIERPKSPYPPSYSVTQMGQRPGDTHEQRDFVKSESEAAMFAPLARKLSEKLSIISPTHSTDEEEESMDGSTSEAASDVPEVPISPRSDLGIFTPSFDSRSEISVASHEPIAPSSPRIDPEEPIFPDSATRTPVGKVPAHVDAADSALSTDASESITPLPAPLVPLQGVYMSSTEVKEPEVSTAEEPGSDTLQVETEDTADNDDADQSVISESLSGLTSDSDIEAVSTDGRLTTIPPSEAHTEVDSEVDSSAFDGDIESHHPASSNDSMDSDSWAQDTDVELASLPDTDSVHAEQGRASSEAEQSEPEIIQNGETSQSGSEISESEAHESPVLVATPKTEPAPSEADSEFEAISNPGIALTVRELSDSMSELDTIRDDSTFAGPIEDMPDIPSSVSQLAIPESDEGSGAPTPRPESPAADSSLSLDYADSDANASFDFVSVAKNTETEPTTADEEDNTLMMPKMYPQQSLDSDTGSIEPLDDDTVRQHLSDAPPSPAEPAIVGQSVEREPALLVNKQLPELPVFPTIVTPSEPSSSVSPKAFPGGLVALDEESSVSDFIPVSPTLGVRRRLESTASSLVFPGAWVVSPVPPERASLEVATGEFSRPPPGEFSRSNSGASPDSTPLVTPTTEDEEKRRCIIM